MGPTPLHRMENASKRLGIDLWVKRDDLLPLALGGNKVRQLEFYFGQAQERGADTILITGAIQSNFVRLCAAAARKTGLRPVVQLERRVPKTDQAYNQSGNVLLLNLLGAEITIFDGGDDEAAADANLDGIAERLRSEGAKPYVIHLGIDHPPVGALGYVAAAVETDEQWRAIGLEPQLVVIPSGSGLTHAGFLVGLRGLRCDVPVQGICVRRDAAAQKKRIERRAVETAQILDTVPPEPSDVEVSDAVLPPGYGQMSDAVRDAMRCAAQEDGIILDPVYSGRTFAGLIDLVNRGRITAGETVIFVHTGGQPALFAYQSGLDRN